MTENENELFLVWRKFLKGTCTFEKFKHIAEDYGECKVYHALLASLVALDISQAPFVRAIKENRVNEFFEGFPFKFWINFFDGNGSIHLFANRLIDGKERTEITKDFLINWWVECSKVIYSPDELKQFEDIIDKYGVEKIYTVVITSFLVEDGSPTTLLMAMRDDGVEILLDFISERLGDVISKVILDQISK